MAIIKCPNCGMEVSDQAEQCIHCGYNLKKENLVVCKDCGKTYSEQFNICPNCGCPRTVVSTVVEKPKRSFMKYIIGAILIVLAGLLFMGVQSVKKEEDYRNTVNATLDEINESVDDLNSSYNLMINVWRNGIWGDRDSTTDPYVYPKGVKVKDFDEALENLYKDKKFMTKVEHLDKTQQELRTLKLSLEDVPKEYEDMNDVLVKIIDIYVDSCMLEINPAGSLLDITNRQDELTTEYNSLMAEMDAYMKKYSE